MSGGIDVWMSGGLEVVKAWRSCRHGAAEVWRSGGCWGTEARSGGLEGVQVWRPGGLKVVGGMEARSGGLEGV